MPLLLGELAGNRVLRVGAGITDAAPAGATVPVLAYGELHDLYPLEGGGTVVFTQLDVTIRHTAGFKIGVTPIVDGTALPEQVFQGGAPGVNDDGQLTLEAPFRARGARCAAIVRALAAFGALEYANVQVEFVPVRGFMGIG